MMSNLINRKPRIVQFMGLYTLLLVVLLCSYAGIQNQAAEKLACPSKNENVKAAGHVSEMLFALKTFILFDSEDTNTQ